MRVLGCSKALSRIFFWQLVLFIALVTGSQAFAAPVKLAAALYQDHGVSRRLTLWRLELPPLGRGEFLSYRRDHPKENGFPNTVFLLTSADAAATSEGEVLWVRYILDDLLGRPRTIWSVGIATSLSGDDAHIVLVKSVGWDVTLEVHQVSLNHPLASYPVNLDPASYESWPKSPEPVSVLSKTLLGREISGISEVSVVEKKGDLVVHGIRDQSTSLPVTIRFKLDSKQWSEVEFEDKSGKEKATPQSKQQ
jgi:hypothetical protein